ncbi:uncharacterized protein LOC108455591 [Gossypium arboreum]|uniref:uncharacterized protein LOC108455591 n=1 Tax=Gossypium arboreum TaxID=29729 RepID=UPI0008196F8B|nr:uncharacterized protein LOC108455591 [Gossypium arboreum]
MPNVEAREAPASLETGTGSHDRADDALSQAMLRILQRVVGPNIEVTERIMDDLDCTPEQKLKGTVSLLRDEAYQWWLTVKEGTQPDRLTWEFFKTSFQGKYMGASYVDARRREFVNLTQGGKSVVEYAAEFLYLSRYARGIVAKKYERCVQFENGLRDNLRRKEQEGLGTLKRPKKKARIDGPIRVGPPATAFGSQPCTVCGKHLQGECWVQIGACLRCGSLEHHIRDCPRRLDQMQATGMGTVQPSRGVQ